MRPFLRLALVLAFLLSADALRADTYKVFQLQSDQGYYLDGFDDKGDASFVRTSCGTGASDNCYYFFFDGVYQLTTFTAQQFGFDGGIPCSPTPPPSTSLVYGVCNNGRYAFLSNDSALSPNRTNVYVGPDPTQLLALGSGGRNFLLINARGDVLWDDVFTDHFYEAILQPAPVPEPCSIALLSTGLLFIGTVLRRRLSY